jgi:hypothetical protein
MATGVSRWEGRNWPPGPPRLTALALAWLGHQNFASAESEARQNFAGAESEARQNFAPAQNRRTVSKAPGGPPTVDWVVNPFRPCPYPCCSR